MLIRQRIILGLIQDSGGTLGRILLFKYVFLLSKEWAQQSNLAFYDFVPFKYGPYSFALARELEILGNYGYIVEDGDSWKIAAGMELATNEVVGQVPAHFRYQTSELVKKIGKIDLRQLLVQIYRSYPDFTFRSKLHECIPPGVKEPPTAPLRIYTMGYEGKSVDSFLNLILQKGLKAIVDVRANPISRKYGFAKTTLARLAEKLDLQYWHLPELGIPSRDRKGLGSTLSHDSLFDDYEFRVLPSRLSFRQVAVDLVTTRPSALVCMEDNPLLCHRSRLAGWLAPQSGLAVQHL